MLKLNIEKVDIINPLLNNENAHYPLLKAILSGKKRGSVYVNCLETPSTAAVISEDGWLYLLGKEDNEDFNIWLESFLSQKISKEKTPILWFGISEIWRKRLESHNLFKIGDYPRNQYEFIYDKYILHKVSKPVPVYEIESINEENICKVFDCCEDIQMFWGTEENFIKYGFGFILLDKGKIIGHALSASVEEGEAEIDIQTNECYRGSGIATYLTSKLIEECIARHLIPKWDCAANNVASNKLAMKLGFEKIREYPFCFISSI